MPFESQAQRRFMYATDPKMARRFEKKTKKKKLPEKVKKSSMDLAMRLIKQNLELEPPITQGVEEQVPMQEDIPMVDMQTTAHYNDPCECAEEIRIRFRKEVEEDLKYFENHEFSDRPDVIGIRQDLIDLFHNIDLLNCEQLLEIDEAVFGGMCNSAGAMGEADQMKYTGEPMDIAFQLLKASRQMKLYNYIEDYPNKEPVTAYRGVPFPTTQPMLGTQWYQKDTPIDLDKKGTWWVEGGAEPHATASFFARMPNEPGPDNERATVLGYRGKLENIGDVQRRRNEWNPANDAKMDEAFVSHDQPIDWENIVFSQPSESVTDKMSEEEHDKWINNFLRNRMEQA